MPVQHARSRAGFTLLEIMVALAILGTSVATILAMLAVSTGAAHRTDTQVLLTELADHRLTELLGGEVDRERMGWFEAPYQAFRWRARISPGPVPGTETLEVSAAGAGDSVSLATVRAR